MGLDTSDVILCLDPGLREAGVAVFTKNQLAYAGLARNTEHKARGPRAWAGIASAVWELAGKYGVTHIVSEYPQAYLPKRNLTKNVNPNDLLELAGAAGATVGAFQLPYKQVLGYLPAEWKGQLPKEVCHARMFETLTAPEVKRISPNLPQYLAHNVYDAVAIGLHHLGRRPSLDNT